MADKRRKLTAQEKAGAAVVTTAIGGTAVAGARIAIRNRRETANARALSLEHRRLAAANKFSTGKPSDRMSLGDLRKAHGARVQSVNIGAGTIVPKPAPKTPAGPSKTASVIRAAARGTGAVIKGTASTAAWAVRAASRDITGVKGVAGVATKAGRAEAASGGKQAVATIKNTLAAAKDARAANLPFRETAKIVTGGSAQAWGQASRLIGAAGGFGKIALAGIALTGAGVAAYKTYKKGSEANAADNVATAVADSLTGGGTKTFRERVAQGDSLPTAAARGFASFVDRKLTFGAGQAAKDTISNLLVPASNTSPKGQGQDQSAVSGGLGAAIAAGLKSGHAGQNTPLPPQPKGGASAEAPKGTTPESKKKDRVAYTKVDGTTVQLTQAQAAAAKASRNDGQRTPGGALKAA